MLLLTGGHLTIEDVIAVAYGQPNDPRVVLSDESHAKSSADDVSIACVPGYTIVPALLLIRCAKREFHL